jgi:hypothetical protein
MDCPHCDFDAKTRASLANHVRRAHAGERPAGANMRAIEETLAALKLAGRLESVDAAKVQALRSMAEALDLNPFNSQMWREYREAIEGLTRNDGGSDQVDDLLDKLSASVRNS